VLPVAFLRSTFVWTANLTLVLLFCVWQPLPGAIWQLEQPFLVGALHGLQGFGWMLALASTFALGHLQMFGVAQAWRWYRRRPQPTPRLQVGFFYRIVRHPLLLGLLVGFWA